MSGLPRNARVAFLHTSPAAIAAGVRAARPAADVIVLAQASMAPAAERLEDLGVPVFSSPGPGVQRIVEHLNA